MHAHFNRRIVLGGGSELLHALGGSAIQRLAGLAAGLVGPARQRLCAVGLERQPPPAAGQWQLRGRGSRSQFARVQHGHGCGAGPLLPVGAPPQGRQQTGGASAPCWPRAGGGACWPPGVASPALRRGSGGRQPVAIEGPCGGSGGGAVDSALAATGGAARRSAAPCFQDAAC
eukprot:7450762-Lingulodinium_polyedra.AAC.1